MIRHIVMWRLKDRSPASLEKTEEVLMGMKGKIPGMLSIEVGTNFNTSDAAFDIVLVSVHLNKEDLDNYQVHPAYLQVKAFTSQASIARAVVDYKF